MLSDWLLEFKSLQVWETLNEGMQFTTHQYQRLLSYVLRSFAFCFLRLLCFINPLTKRSASGVARFGEPYRVSRTDHQLHGMDGFAFRRSNLSSTFLASVTWHKSASTECTEFVSVNSFLQPQLLLTWDRCPDCCNEHSTVAESVGR